MYFEIYTYFPKNWNRKKNVYIKLTDVKFFCKFRTLAKVIYIPYTFKKLLSNAYYVRDLSSDYKSENIKSGIAGAVP